MLDQKFNLFFKPVLKKIATIFLKYQISPNQITLFSFILGIFTYNRLLFFSSVAYTF